VPTWGIFTKSYSNDFWDRLALCSQVMAEQGFNHPSILAWGLFNEPGANFAAHQQTNNAIVHRIDPTRPTYIANNGVWEPQASATDIVGLNYKTGWDQRPDWKIVNTEYHAGWEKPCVRGTLDPNAKNNEDFFMNDCWKDWQAIVNRAPRLAGGFLWCFNDYHAWENNMPMGIVDLTRVPKKAYYFYREKFTGKKPDYPEPGAATRLSLEPDLTELIADGTDLCNCIVAVRDEAGRCIATNQEVSIHIEGPATIFGPSQVRTIAGKIAVLLKTTTRPGTITLTATGDGLRSSTVKLKSRPISDATVK